MIQYYKDGRGVIVGAKRITEEDGLFTVSQANQHSTEEWTVIYRGEEETAREIFLELEEGQYH